MKKDYEIKYLPIEMVVATNTIGLDLVKVNPIINETIYIREYNTYYTLTNRKDRIKFLFNEIFSIFASYIWKYKK